MALIKRKLICDLVRDVPWLVLLESINSILRIIIKFHWDLPLAVIFWARVIRIQNTGGFWERSLRDVGVMLWLAFAQHRSGLDDLASSCDLLRASGVLLQLRWGMAHRARDSGLCHIIWLHSFASNCASQPVILNSQEVRFTGLKLRRHRHAIRIASAPGRLLLVARLSRLHPRIERLHLLLPKLLVMIIHDGHQYIQRNVRMVQNGFILNEKH